MDSVAAPTGLFHRHGPYGPLVQKEVFQGDVMAILGPLMASTATDKASKDTGTFLAYLDRRADVAGRKVGAVGFCMGGGLATDAPRLTRCGCRARCGSASRRVARPPPPSGLPGRWHAAHRPNPRAPV